MPRNPSDAADAHPNHSSELEKLIGLLRDLFQLGEADLDFGMYRVLRLRREELTTFLEKTLIHDVQQAMGAVATKERSELETQMHVLEEQARRFNGDLSADSEYQALRERLGRAGDAATRERLVYAHLREFFSRYYEDGDFISLPRFRAGTYAIPYDGSEVVLHWANKDQYYVKSGEYFARYAFQLGDGRRVVFRLVDAATDPDNVKSADSGKRRFMLVDDDAVGIEDGALVCRFIYAVADGKQDVVNAATVARVVEAAPEDWRPELDAEKIGQTSKDKLGLLAWHLRQYTEKNKRDYFIHKDLGGFLRRELDHYLKTEVFDLDSVERMTADDVSRAVTMLKTVRAVATPIITFLASIEDFQKRLFLKKKMVLRTDWCVTLDRVPEEFFPEIAANKAQVQRWRELFAIQDIPPVLGDDARGETVSVDFLKRNRGLVVETRLLNRTAADQLIAALGPGLEGSTAGVIARAENRQALGLLTARHLASIACMYIDPPYNTGSDGFQYKDCYQHSSWAAMLVDRLMTARRLFRHDALTFTSIDDGEVHNLRQVADIALGSKNFVSAFVWNCATAGGIRPRHVSQCHEYAISYAADKAALPTLWAPLSPEAVGQYRKADARGAYREKDFAWRNTSNNANQRYGIEAPDGSLLFPAPGYLYRFVRDSFDRALTDNTVVFKATETSPLVDATGARAPYNIYIKKYLGAQIGAPASVPPRGLVGLSSRGGETLAAMFGAPSNFQNPKSTDYLEYLLTMGTSDDDGDVVLDFFAGSGTTGHAVLNLNREDNGNRKFILVEVNDYFDTVLLPRILKATYSKDWKDGKPVDRTPVPGGGLYKVLYLESYEDTLANITLPPPPSDNPLPFAVQSDYTIRYMLDHETRTAVLDLDRFRKPFSWTMEVRRGGLVTKDHPVDLVETFNYLIGLHVSRYGFFKDFGKIRYVEGRIKADDGEQRVLVLWRDCDLVSDDELVRLFDDREFAPVSSREYDRIYVNGDPPLANIKRLDEQWKVLAIEDEFKRLSFADDDV